MKFKIQFTHYHYFDEDFSENLIYLSRGKLDELELKQNSFVQLNLFKNDDLLIKKRVFKCTVLDNARDDSIYLSSLIWFNLTKDNQNQFDFVNLDQYHVTIISNSILQPKLINECHFVLIKSPEYNGSVNYDGLFKSFFNFKRYIEKDDLIAIDTIHYPQIYNEYNMKSSVKQTFIFFKCTSLDKMDKGFIDQNETRVYLTGSKNSYIPRDLLYYTQINSIENFIKYDKSIVQTTMLTSYFVRLKQTVQPYLKVRSLLNFVLLTGELGSGKDYLINELACQFRMNLIEFEADDFLNETSTINETKLKSNFELITIYSPCIAVIKNVDILIKSLEGNEFRFIDLIDTCLDNEKQKLNSIDYPILLIATSSTMNCDQINENFEFSKLFTQQLHVDDLRYEERFEILQVISTKIFNQQFSNQKFNQTYQMQDRLSDQQTFDNQIDLDLLAKETNGLNLNNLINLFKKSLQSLNQIDQLTTENLLIILNKYKKNLKTKNHLPDIPNVNWSDVGGLLDAKKEIFSTIRLTLEYGKFLKLRRTGLLFYGPPGTGKTLLAKAIATEFKLNFLSVKGPEIMNMYIGQSEENVRNIFMKAKSVAPSIIFFDELDSIARKRGKNNSSSGVMDRLVSTLLTELDSLKDSNIENDFKPVFVIGATNRPDLLDPALLVHGRFDKMVFIGLDNSKEQRLSILKAITKKFDFDDQCTLESIEFHCPKNLTGADFYGLCSNAYLNALKRKINSLELNSEPKSNENIDDRVEVNLEDFKESIRNLRISIDESELQKYEQLKKSFLTK